MTWSSLLVCKNRAKIEHQKHKSSPGLGFPSSLGWSSVHHAFCSAAAPGGAGTSRASRRMRRDQAKHLSLCVLWMLGFVGELSWLWGVRRSRGPGLCSAGMQLWPLSPCQGWGSCTAWAAGAAVRVGWMPYVEVPTGYCAWHLLVSCVLCRNVLHP